MTMAAATVPLESTPGSRLKVLMTFAKACFDEFKRLECPGEMSWTVATLEHRTGLCFNYTDENGISTYYVFLGKRFFGKDILRVFSPDDKSEKIMEADAKVFLAYLTF